MRLDDLGDALDLPRLTLPVRGFGDYVVEPASGDTWLRLQRLAKLVDDKDAASGISNLELMQMSLGDTFDKLIADNVPGPLIEIVGTTAFYWQVGNHALATLFWKSEGKALAPRRSRSTRTTTGAASTTRRRASGTGTRNSPKK